ncbi:amidase domain-containing protein [Amnibacterium sp.]|uniref:amidase domain-containing protein n=1 Tax=Amnibacterium sp. TaxID=1872496 RepID=UPI002621B98F|nr:amidase domain-containing protein [Amnibacterium sp.]MCU1474652.1 hypothetical protein [Amnibacterium sp.]
MPFDPRRCASLVAVATLLAGLALNVAIGSGADALTRPLGAGAAPSSSTTPRPDASPTPSRTAAPSPTPTLTPTPTPTPLPEPVAASLSRTSGGTAARRTVEMRGTSMANVARVVVGDQDAEQLTLLSPTEIRFVIPEAEGFAPGTVAISLVSATDGATIPTRYRWTYAVLSAVDREMAYAATHWNRHVSARFGYIPKNDCVNFTSQLLAARGWRESAAWWNDGPVSRTVTKKKTVVVPTEVTVTTTSMVKGAPVVKTTVKTVPKKVVKTVKKVVTTVDASAAWVSSTAMSRWLASRPDLATRLTYGQRAEVRVGDVVQFNWSGVGSWWDHTAVVSKIVVASDGTQKIWYAEHTNHRLYGGSIGALTKLAGYEHMRVQFWQLKH